MFYCKLDAALCGHVLVCETLLSAGANKTAKTHEKKTPADVAVVGLHKKGEIDHAAHHIAKTFIHSQMKE
eukprot:UC4_evm7s1335